MLSLLGLSLLLVLFLPSCSCHGWGVGLALGSCSTAHNQSPAEQMLPLSHGHG